MTPLVSSVSVVPNNDDSYTLTTLVTRPLSSSLSTTTLVDTPSTRKLTCGIYYACGTLAKESSPVSMPMMYTHDRVISATIRRPGNIVK